MDISARPRLIARGALVAGLSVGALALAPALAHAGILGSAAIAAEGTTVSAELTGIVSESGRPTRCAFALFAGTVAAEQVDSIMEIAMLQKQILYPNADSAIASDAFPAVSGDSSIAIENVAAGTYRAVVGCAESDGEGMPSLATAVILANTAITVEAAVTAPPLPPETLVETPAETPAESPAEAPAETPAETPAESPAEASAEASAAAPADVPAGAPVEGTLPTPPPVLTEGGEEAVKPKVTSPEVLPAPAQSSPAAAEVAPAVAPSASADALDELEGTGSLDLVIELFDLF